MSLALAPGVSFCIIEGTRIFLDRRRDRYFSFGPATNAAFDAIGSRRLDEEQASRLAELVKSGILVDDPFGEAPRPCRSTMVRSSPLDDDPHLPASAVAAVASAISILKARAVLRLRGFDDALAAVENVYPSRRHAISIASAEQSKIAGRFARAARLTGSLGQCLPISLAMAGFCRRREFDVQFVIGVKIRPFQAHAWVSANGIVLSDCATTASQFTPILIL